jgi:radical SAM protein with 4Fe4S-binding SPASM domain
LATIHRLAQLGKPFRVAMLVSPQTVGSLADGIEFLFNMGVPRIEPVLDHWADWDEEGLRLLEQAIARAASVWAEFRPRHGVSWFDRPGGSTSFCRFGRGQIAVAPSGHLYPCMSIIGDDADDNAARLPGHALQGSDFAEAQSQALRCGLCDTSALCGTIVRCGTAPARPSLLTLTELKRRWDQACRVEVARALRDMPAATST